MPAVLIAGLALAGCTNRSNSSHVTSGPHGPASPAMSGNYGSKTDLAPPYGGTKHAEPNVQSTGGNQGSERTANLTTANASKQHPIAPKPENHAAPEADHGE